MRSVVILVVLTSWFGLSVQRSTPTDDSYVAAVLEYQPKATTGDNLESYLSFIQQAAKQVLVAISEAARQHQIYVAINIEELMNCSRGSTEYCPSEQTYLFNSNVVFDRSGAVIDRYCKINLFGERRSPSLRPDLGVFNTDFGVRFGHYISFDIQFQVPSFQVIEMMNITDIIFTAMWYSGSPYLTGVQVQEAVAFAQNINFLGSGANDVSSGSAGSGIYSGKAGALASTMPGIPTTRLLVATVPKVPSQVTAPVPGPTYDPPSDHDSLFLLIDPSVAAHVTRPLLPGYQEFTLTHREVTCSYKIDVSDNQALDGVQKHKYRAGAFGGVRNYSGFATGGVRVCSVFACTGNTIDTCARRFPVYNPNTTAIFNELTIIATVPTPVMDAEVQARDSGYFPVSLTLNMMPLETKQFSYSEESRANVTELTMSLKNKEVELFSFAVWGRYFSADGQEFTTPRDDHSVAGDDLEEDPVTEEGEQGSAAVHHLSWLVITTIFLLNGVIL